MWMRSATSNTCGMLCEMRMIGKPALLDVEDEFEHAARFFHAERRRRLVHDDDAAREGGRARHGDALALAARQRLDRLVDVLDRHQPDLVQLFARELLHRGAIEGAEELAHEARRSHLRAPGTYCRRSTRRATARGSGRRSRCPPRARRSASGNERRRRPAGFRPASGITAPQSALISVDLPAPLSPMTARISPG